MKKKVGRGLLSFVLVFAMLTALCSGFLSVGAAAANTITEAPDVKIIIAGEQKTYEQVPLIINGSTFLPLRALASSLGIPNDDQHIIWNQAEKSVALKSADNSRTIYLSIGSLEGKINGSPHVLNAAPVLYKNSTYIPLRFVADALDMTVLWDAPERCVYIRDAVEYEEIYLAASSVQPPLYSSGVTYTKQILQKEYAQKTGTVLGNYESNGEYTLRIENEYLFADAKVDSVYNNQKLTETYRSDEEGVYYTTSRGDEGYLTAESETDFYNEIFADLGLSTGGEGEEDDSAEQEEQANIEAGGLSFIEKLCMYADWKVEGDSASLTIPYHKIQVIDDCEYYNRTFVFDLDSYYLQKDITDIRWLDEENGVNIAIDQTITIVFQ